MKWTIYLITCLSDKKIYVGQTRTSLSLRWQRHKAKSYSDSKSGRSLSTAIATWGFDAFSISTLATANTQKQANKLEIAFIKKLQSTNPCIGYNLTFGGNQYEVTEEFRKKISKTSKGRVPSEETKRRLSLAMSGRRLSIDHRKKISKSHTGMKFSGEALRKVRELTKNPTRRARVRKALQISWKKRKGLLLTSEEKKWLEQRIVRRKNFEAQARKRRQKKL